MRNAAVESGKILGFFIEEAKEHLETLEKGLLDLRGVMADQERINEMFRAAHSVKGGAAMLGFNSIQKVSHRFEDCFKLLKEHPVNIDNDLESMFLEGYDTLKHLVDQLQGPFGLREEEGEKIVQAAEPNFVKLQAHLNHLLGAAGSAPEASKTSTPDISAQVTGVLKQMLPLFKQAETPANRQQLCALCSRLVQMSAEIKTWQVLVRTANRAIANPKNTYATLAPIVIKELKQASDLLPHGKTDAIAPSASLRLLAASPEATTAPIPPAKVAVGEGAPSPTESKPTPTSIKQIAVPVEPRAAAKVLAQVFNKEQLLLLAKLLHQASR
ncbi:Hpt domain-containing protein [Coleofasciculus sp. FACHB-SPT9]|uniref:Hpt domain-containing protein n=1 Tax=Coleofasciculus sp. FACHB-SPT9 TaxID=2692791 RepID=UPI001A7EA0DD|nr:Hpt domain-containing protein [Coleofasciculus sp. FACHB-SPT9]